MKSKMLQNLRNLFLKLLSFERQPHLNIGLVLLQCFLFFLTSTIMNGQVKEFTPGKVIYDTDGNLIKAYDGGISYYNGLYHWYGEFKNGDIRTSEIPCYTSTDLLNWTYKGNMVPGINQGQLANYPILERPHVIYNDKTQKYVMWIHLENDAYTAAITGVFISDSSTGPFTLNGIFHDNGPRSGDADYTSNRDHTIFKDDDGRAYHIFSCYTNNGLVISEMNNDYLTPKGYSINTTLYCEAPTFFKYNGVYFMSRSECSGFGVNDNKYATADSMMGHWTDHGIFSQGPNSTNTFSTQVTEVVKVRGKDNAFIFVGDRWGEPLNKTFDLFLPITLTGPKSMAIYWQDKWDLSFFDKINTSVKINSGGNSTGNWSSDAYFTGGNTSSTTNTVSTSGVTDAAPAEIYQDCRWGANTYTIRNLKANTSQKVYLHFAEWYWTSAGQRKFNVKINGTNVLSEYDIFGDVGLNKAAVKVFTIQSDAGGQIQIEFINGSADEPAIMGIDIEEVQGLVTTARIYPRSSFTSRMQGGKFQGSNDNSSWTDLGSITTVPPESSWTSYNLTSTTTWRYLRYLSPAGGYGNISELEFYNGSTKLVGTPIGTAGSWSNAGNTKEKALDGDVSTFFDAPTGDNNYVGIDTQGTTAARISNEPGKLHTVPSSSDLRIYPNPATSEVTIDSETPWLKFSVLDINGKEKLSRTSYNKTEKIELSGMQPGVYVIKIQTREGIQIKKLIIY